MNNGKPVAFVLIVLTLLATQVGLALADEPVSKQKLPLANGSMVAYWRKQPAAPGPRHLLIHFHGPPRIVSQAFDRSALDAVLVVVNFPGLSTAYSRPFAENENLFQQLLESDGWPTSDSGIHKNDSRWQSVTVSSFSAGYGAIREILKSPEYFDRIDRIVTADSIYAGLQTDHPVREVSTQNMKDFVRFATLAADGKKTFVLSHSAQQTPYASTTETADYLLKALSLSRQPDDTLTTGTFQQSSRANRGRFAVFGFAGQTGKDHMRHLHNIDLLWKRLPWTIADQTAAASDNLLALTAESTSQADAAKQLGLLDIAPVNLPAGSAGDCNHLGWPIATMTGDTIIVMHRQIPGHKAKGAGRPDPTMSYGIVVRSEDGGETWSPPYDLRDCMRPEDKIRGGIVPLSHRAKFDKSNKSRQGYKVHLHSIGTTRDGAVVAINNHGVFRSDDAGRTWKHFSTALRDDNFPHEIINLGPRLLDHPKYGLVVFGNWFGEVDSYHKLSHQLVALTSPDGGATWNVEEHDTGFPQYEPAALIHDGRFLFVTRDQTKVRSHKQINWVPGTQPIIVGTNLEDPRLVDTVDFCFNPVTKRFEIVRSQRHNMELWLWSMDPADWEHGTWRRECRLLARRGTFYSNADGFHPAGAVVDRKRGVQHIFIYAGHPNGPAGVFRITRTLETPTLSADLGH